MNTYKSRFKPGDIIEAPLVHRMNNKDGVPHYETVNARGNVISVTFKSDKSVSYMIGFVDVEKNNVIHLEVAERPALKKIELPES